MNNSLYGRAVELAGGCEPDFNHWWLAREEAKAVNALDRAKFYFSTAKSNLKCANEYLAHYVGIETQAVREAIGRADVAKWSCEVNRQGAALVKAECQLALIMAIIKEQYVQ